MPVTETAEVVLHLSAYVHEENEIWVAGCPSLDVFSQGGSAEEARANLREAVELWIDSCLERNTLGEALRELGWYRVPPGTSLAAPDLTGAPDSGETPTDLGEEYPLEVTIPAYQAALFSDRANRALG